MRVVELDERTIRDWVSLMAKGSTPTGRVRTYANGRVSTGGRECYSYGRHFPLARYVPRNGAHGPLFVINGDRWNGPMSRTNDHQDAVRRAIAASGVPSIIIPFSALGGAGINPDTIRPLHVRPDEQWTETIERRTLAELPLHRRTYSVQVPRESRSLTDVPEHMRKEWRYANGRSEYREKDRDPDGFYRWTVSERRQTEPDPDGIYRWQETRHRMGDSLFTAVREQTFVRDAAPFESETDGRTVTVRLASFHDSHWRQYCESANEDGNSIHEAGPSGACIRCGRPLRATVTWRRRARYLSSFDTNENPPLYFLCEVSRNGHPTVEGAIDSLAPRAVHAALLNGTEVRRQGDIFLIDTPLTDSDLAARGATFARLTQWTRDAKPRPGEVTYVHRTPAQRRELARKERNYARRLFRERWRTDIAALQLRDVAQPQTGKDSRKRWRKLREQHAAELAAAQNRLRRATFGATPLYNGMGEQRRYGTREGMVEYRRRLNLQAIANARQNLARASAPLKDSNGHLHARHGRDTYRRCYGTNAVNLWSQCLAAARERYRPETVSDREAMRKRRETVRRHLAVYGTAHSATRVARVGTAVYVQGTVTHAVTLEPNRRGGPDHRPIVLTAGRWYLAVRNTVPRQNRRPRAPRRRTESGLPGGGTK